MNIQDRTRSRALADPWPFGTPVVGRLRRAVGDRLPEWTVLAARLVAAMLAARLAVSQLHLDDTLTVLDPALLHGGAMLLAAVAFFVPVQHLPLALAAAGAVPLVSLRAERLPYLLTSLLAVYYVTYVQRRCRHWLLELGLPTLLFLIVPKVAFRLAPETESWFWWPVYTYLWLRVMYYRYEVRVGSVAEENLAHYLFYTTFWPLFRGPLFSPGDLGLLTASRGAWAFRALWTIVVSRTKTSLASWLFWSCGKGIHFPNKLSQVDRVFWACLTLLRRPPLIGKTLQFAGQNFSLRRGLTGLTSRHPAQAWLVFVLSYVYGFLRQSARLDAVTALMRALGFQVRDSFRWVLFSPSPIELWRRWNVHLRTLLIRFFYLPAGGREHHQYRNILFTFLMSAAVVHFGLGNNAFTWGPHFPWLLYFTGEALAVIVAVAVTRLLAQKGWQFPRWVRLLGRVVSWALTILWTSLIRTLIKARTLPFLERWHALCAAVCWRPL